MKDKINRSLHATKSCCDAQMQDQLSKWHDYMAYERHASAHTLYNYILDLKYFFEFLNGYLGGPVSLNHLEGLTLSSFRSFLANRIKNDSSAKSNKRALSAIKNIYAFLYKSTGIKNTQLNELTSPKSDKNLPRPLSHLNTTKLMDLSALYTNQPKWVQDRDEAFFMLLYGCGLRITEALNLNVGDINPQTLRVVGKRNKERIIPMLLPVYGKIMSYLEDAPTPAESTTPLFLGIKGDRLSPRVVQKQMEKIRLALGMPETATPHSLRHSFASHLLAGGADLRSIQELMGHDSLSSTQVYTKLEDQALFEICLKAHPRSNQ